MAGSWQRRCGRVTACSRLATPSSRKFVIRSIPISDAVASVKQSTLGEWQVSGRVAAGERHGVCESVFKTAGEQHGNGMVCVNPPQHSRSLFGDPMQQAVTLQQEQQREEKVGRSGLKTATRTSDTT
jgi:hypothetical protein